MGCDCNKIGGRWIGADPNCDAHGVGGYAEQVDELELQVSELEGEISILQDEVANLEGLVFELQERLKQFE